MNTLSILIYLADVAGSMGSFMVLMATLFGIAVLISLVVFLVMQDETDAYHRPLPEEKIKSQRANRRKVWRWMWVFLTLWISTGILAAATPSRQTVLLIAASEMGERMMNQARVEAVVDPSIELLTTWMRKETENLNRRIEPTPRTR